MNQTKKTKSNIADGMVDVESTVYYTILELDPDAVKRIGPVTAAHRFTEHKVQRCAMHEWLFGNTPEHKWPLTFVLYDYTKENEICKFSVDLELLPSFYISDVR